MSLVYWLLQISLSKKLWNKFLFFFIKYIFGFNISQSFGFINVLYYQSRSLLVFFSLFCYPEYSGIGFDTLFVIRSFTIRLNLFLRKSKSSLTFTFVFVLIIWTCFDFDVVQICLFSIKLLSYTFASAFET